MSAGAVYPGSVETMQIIGDTQQTPITTKTTIKQQQQLKITQPSTIQLVDGGGVVVGETLVNGPPQQTIHLPQMATIVAAPGATPIIVPSAQSRIALAIAPSGATPAAEPLVVPGQVIDFSLMNGSAVGGGAGVAAPSGNEAAAVDGGATEYYFQPAVQPVAGAEVIIGGAAGVAATGIVGTGPVTATSDGTPIPLEQLKQLLGTQLEYYFSR